MLDIENLEYSKDKHLILKKITLKLQTGKVYGLVGPNGSGKTTLLKSIAGIWKPTAGQILWHRRNLHHGSRKEISRWVTFVAQSAAPAFEYTVAEVICMAEYTEEKPLEMSAAQARMRQVLREVGLEHYAERPMMKLSQGERQRVLLARAMFTQAPLLLLDEPFASLDLRHSLRLASQLRYLTSTSHLIILALHDFSLARDLCDEVILLDRGQCIGQGLFDEVMSADRFERIFGVIPLEDSDRRSFALA